MSTQTISSAVPQTPSKDRSIWDRWRQPRIVAVDASTLADATVLSECYTPDGADEPPHGRTHIALASRWKGATVGGAILELRDRTAFVHRLRVDPSCRGRGIGRRLLKSLLQRARLQFVQDVYVTATASDAGFYALHAFRPVEEPHEVGDAPAGFANAADLILRRRLTSGFVSVPYDGFTVKM